MCSYGLRSSASAGNPSGNVPPFWSEEGYEIVEGVKHSRGKESALHKASAGMFYKIMTKAVGIDMSRASDFKLMDKKAVEALLVMPERNTFFRALSSWIGYRTTSVEFDVQEREEGESKWSTWSLIKYALRNIIGFSTAPMQMVTVAGVLVLCMGIILGIQSLYKYFRGQALEGFTTVILLAADYWQYHHDQPWNHRLLHL